MSPEEIRNHPEHAEITAQIIRYLEQSIEAQTEIRKLKRKRLALVKKLTQQP